MGANFVQTTVPDIWCLTSLLNSKYLVFRINAAILSKSFVEIFVSFLQST